MNLEVSVAALFHLEAGIQSYSQSWDQRVSVLTVQGNATSIYI